MLKLLPSSHTSGSSGIPTAAAARPQSRSAATEGARRRIIIKRRKWEDETEDSDEWQIGHPVLVPNILAMGNAQTPTFQIRTPIDDQHTLHYWYRTRVRASDEPVQTRAAVYDYPRQLNQRDTGNYAVAPYVSRKQDLTVGV